MSATIQAPRIVGQSLPFANGATFYLGGSNQWGAAALGLNGPVVANAFLTATTNYVLTGTPSDVYTMRIVHVGATGTETVMGVVTGITISAGGSIVGIGVIPGSIVVSPGAGRVLYKFTKTSGGNGPLSATVGISA